MWWTQRPSCRNPSRLLCICRHISAVASVGVDPVAETLRPFDAFVRERIVQRLSDVGPASRAELMELTGLSRSALSKLVGQLVAAGILQENASSESERRSKGRPARLLSLARPTLHTLALDVDINHVRAGVVDSAGTVAGYAEEVRPLGDGREQAIETIRRLLQRVHANTAATPTRAVVGLPTMVDVAAQQVDPAGARALMPTWADGGTRAALEDALGIPATIAKRSTLATLSEWKLGAGRGLRTFAFVNVAPEGLGLGLVLGGKLFEGARGFAGEISHISLSEEGVICPCGQRGCLAAEVSNQIKLFLEARGNAPGASAYEALAQWSAAGEPAARRLLQDVGAQVGIALGGIANTLGPEAIIIADTLTTAGDDTVLTSLQSSIEAHTHPGIRAWMSVVRGHGGSSAVLRGAGLLHQRSHGAAVALTTSRSSQ